MAYYSVILMYTFVDNKELDSEFLQLIKEKYPDCVKLNESAYAIKNIDFNNIAKAVKAIYDKATEKYPSKGKDYVGILYAAKLADETEKDKFDKIVERQIIGTSLNTKSAI